MRHPALAATSRGGILEAMRNDVGARVLVRLAPAGLVGRTPLCAGGSVARGAATPPMALTRFRVR